MVQKISENKKYWDNFYRIFKEKRPSKFSKWCFKNFKFNSKTILDIGAGNFRDTRYFNKKGYSVDSRDSWFGMPIEKMILEDYPGKPVAYCRFLFHVISDDLENKLLDWIYVNCSELYAEFRSDKDNPKNKDHFRRLINGNDFIKKLIKRNFKIIYFEESRGLSPYKKEDPLLIRVVARNENNFKS